MSMHHEQEFLPPPVVLLRAVIHRATDGPYYKLLRVGRMISFRVVQSTSVVNTLDAIIV